MYTKKQKTIDHNSYAIGQWRRRWSTDSPHLLHIKHHSSTAICLFQRLSIVKILPKAAVQEKNATLWGALDCHTIFQGNQWQEKEIKSGRSLEPQNLSSLLASSKVCHHQHPAHSWNKAQPKNDQMILIPNLVVDDGTKCPNEASHWRNTSPLKQKTPLPG